MSSPPAQRARLSARASHATLAFLVGACGGGAPAQRSTRACRPLPEEAPILRGAAEWAPPRSRFAVDIAVPTRVVLGELERRVPRELARGARVPAGAAGEATYRVRRGAFSLATEGGALVVSSPIDADLELCKPVGPFCPTYGTCRPRLLATATVPVAFRDGYRLGPIAIRERFVEGCELEPIGVDVTPELAGVAAREVAAVERRANDSLPELGSAASLATRLLTLPIALGSELCLRVESARFLSGPVTIGAGDVSVRVGLDGTVRLEEPCGRGERESAPPSPAVEPALEPGIALAVPVTLAWSRVSEELTRSLARAGGRVRVTRAEAGASGDPERPLAVRALLEGDVCGEVTLTTGLRWDAVASRVRLAGARLAPGQPGRARVLAGTAWLAEVERAATVALPAEPSAWRAALERAARTALRELPAGWTGELSAGVARVTETTASTAGVVVIVRVDATAALAFRPDP